MNNEIYKYLSDCECCNICCLRFLKARGNEYECIEESLQKLGIDIKEMQININGLDVKKKRKNPCIACLDLFSEDLNEEILKRIETDAKLKEYDCNEFVLALSFPMLLNIRQLSLWIALIKKFGKKFDQEKPPDVPLKEAVKLILGPKVSNRINKIYNPNGIMINITMNHINESKEIEKIKRIENEIYKEKLNKNKKKQKITRGFLDKYFIPNKINLEIYEKYMPVPPDISSSQLFLETVTFTGPTVFVAGRYRKFSRHLSHSPWILDGKRIMEDSIQEIIIRIVSPHFGVLNENIIFSSSGREDVDVRCLGDGRPFVLEIPDSKLTHLSTDIANEIELEIEKSKLVSIHNLQIVKREELSHLKTGEEHKRKIYRALCILEKPATLEIMKKLDMPNGFETWQITPIRVLHRRPLHKRPRTIYSVKAYVDRNNPRILVLDIITQAGTYIKELVHGDFGRTYPSISSVLGIWIDIIALDVTAVELEWPRKINNRINRDSEKCTEINHEIR